MEKNPAASELYDYLDLIFDTTIIIAKHLKDGAQFADIIRILSEIFGDSEFRKRFHKAIDGTGKIPAEIAEMDVSDSIALAMKILPFVPRLIAELQDND